MEQINWTELVVTDSEGGCNDTLGDIVRASPANLDDATIEDGRISEWPGFFLSAPGEDPNWDTPRAEVDWTGFVDTLNAVCGWATTA
jgi:hypothetical protein